MNTILPGPGMDQTSFPKRTKTGKTWSFAADWTKNLYGFLTLFTVLLLGVSPKVSAQTTLAAGDVAIIGMNPAGTDSFAFVLLRDIQSGTIINVTDNAMSSPTTGRTNEGYLTWTAPGARTAGTVISWTAGMNVSGTGWNSGAPANFALNNSGEQLFLFQGSTSNWGTQSGITLLYGINFGIALLTSGAADSSTTYQPANLALGTTFLNFPETLYRNAYFANQATSTSSVTVSGTPSQLLALFADKNNWFGNTTTTNTFPTWNITVVFGATIGTGGTTASVNTTYGTASGATSFTASGTNLTANITVTPPSGFEVSKTSGTSGFAATQTLTQSGGTVANTTIWVRLAATTTAGSYSGNVTMTSGAASATKAIPASTVSKKTITVSNAVAENKIYDRTNVATITGATANGLVNGDVITVTGGGTFANALAESGKPVTANLSLTGTNASSYILTQPTALTADITAKDITLTAISVSDKTYDGTTEATFTATLNGVISPDEVLLNPTANFTSPFVSNDIPVVSSSSIFGADAANYNLVQPTGLTADITAKPLTIDNATAQNKVYDGNTNAVITGTLNGVIAPDEVTLILQGQFQSPNVGLAIPVTSTSFITGDISNYTLVQPQDLSANISAQALEEQTITFDALADVTYGDANFGLTATASSGLAVSYTSSDDNVASVSGSTVTIHGVGTATITATQSGDLTYDAAEPVAQTLTVLPKELTVLATAQGKTYDANTSATITGTLQGIVGSDDVIFVGNGTFVSPNAGTAIEIISASSIGGADVANYTLAQPTGLSADITPKPLTVANAQANDKPYDTTDAASISGGELVGILNNDDVALDGFAGTFASANVGNGISVTAALTLQGSAAANYSLTQPSGLSADITPVELTIFGFSAQNKVYDGTTTATLSGTPELSGVLNTDEVTLSGNPAASFEDKNAGIAKPISVSGYILGGAQAGNYTLATSSGISADITPAALTIANAQAQDKDFDGTTAATITGTLSGVISPDAVTLVGTGTFAQSSVGTNIAVTSTSTLAGTDAANYTIDPQPTGLSADILAAPVVLANWTYEPLQGASATPTPNVGTGTSALVGAMTGTGTATGMNSASGCGAQTSGTNAWAIQTAAPGTSNESSGARFSTSTVGYQNIKFTWEQRWSNTAANTVRVQYTLNGTSWTNFTMTESNTTYCLGSINNGRFQASSAGDQYRRVSVNLSEILGAKNNPNFGVRVVAAHYQNTGEFRQTATTSSVATGGTWRFDNVKFEGMQIPGPSASVISGMASICAGENTNISVAITGGTAPFTVVLSDGTNNVTVNNYASGSAIAVNPSVTTTYTIVSVTDANAQLGSNNSGSAMITVKEQFPFYVDADFDGYGAAATSTVMVCAIDANTPPTGYSTNNTDCNDALSAVHPNAPEVPYNGIDDDCDGTIDEGSQIFSQVLPSQCGTTLATISSLIGAVNYAAPVDGYRFKVVNVSTNVQQTIDRNVPNFQLTQLPTYEYATTYSISVQLRRNGQWLNYYGPACQISTPAILDQGGAAAVNPSQCGIVLPSISTLIATTSLPGVTAYRFRVTDVVTNAQQTIERNYHWFSLTMLNSFLYGRTYSVEVAVKTNGEFSGFGQPCQVTSPAIPQLANCGITVPTTGTLVYTTSLNRVTSYRFQLTNLNTMTTTIVDRNQHYFSFNNVPGFIAGAQYAVQVAVMTAGSWSDFGEACTVTAPGAARNMVKGYNEDSLPEPMFKAVAYPSPFTESFALNMDTSSENSVTVSVYDMVGRLVEAREFAVGSIESQQFGERFPSGVYNVIVSQGANVKTLRVIKR